MPTDDDYGRRERLLLQQHPIAQYGTSSSPSSGSNSNNSGNVGSHISSTNPSDSFKQHQQLPSQQQQQHQLQQDGDSRTIANTASGSSHERYHAEQTHNNENVDYGTRERTSGIDRHDKSIEKTSLDDFAKARTDVRLLQTSCERFSHYQNQERFNQSNLQSHHSYTPAKSSSSTQSLSQNGLADRFSRFNELSPLHSEQRLSLPPSGRFQQGAGNELRFHHSTNESTLVSSGDYANANILVSACPASPFSSETFPSPPSPAPANDRFVPPPPLSPSPSEKYASTQSLAGYPPVDRILPPGSPGGRFTSGTAPASPLPAKERFSSAERLLGNSQPTGNSLHDSKDQQRYSGVISDRFLSGSSPVLGSLQVNVQNDRNSGICTSSKDSNGSRYDTISTDRLLAPSPIHAPVPERFANKSTVDKYLGESPINDRYHRQETASSIHHDRFSTISSTTERYFSISPNPESAHQRYSSTERSLQISSNNNEQSRRLYTDRTVETVCQKYTDRSETSPAPMDFSRFSTYQEFGNQSRYVSTSDRFNDLALQRCNQSRQNDRFAVSSDRYLVNSSPGHDVRLASSEASRYDLSGSSTERLLATTSSSSSTTETCSARHHSSYTNTTVAQATPSSNDRFTPISPTPDTSTNHRGATPGPIGTIATGTNSSSGGGTAVSGGTTEGTTTSYQNTSKNCVDKYLQVSKPVQSYSTDRYSTGNPNEHQFDRVTQERYERFSNAIATSTERFTPSSSASDRFHPNSDRYSPARCVTADKYLSLPKSKDRFTGRITPISSSSASAVVTSTERAYSSSGSASSYVPPTAHTPVERYVPQPPPEVLYPDRYVDRYVPPAAHTPTDRYVPANDPGDPYMRRDLGFHHHYRLPPPTGYPYHQSHFRFRGFTYAPPNRLGGSPGSSSSSSSTSNQRDGFSMSPLLRPKVRSSAVEFATNSTTVVSRHVCTNPPACCNEASVNRSCCQVARRSLPPGALASIPTQPNHSSCRQPSPSSATTATSTVSSSGPETETTQGMGVYSVGNATGSTSEPTTASTPSSSSSSSGGSSVGIASSGGSNSVNNGNTPTVALASSGTGTPAANNINRSISTPSTQRSLVQVTNSVNHSISNSQRSRVKRTSSRTEAIRNYIKRETAQFFGIDEESESTEKQRWLDRRRRMAAKKYGALVPEHRPPDPDITRDVPDTSEVSDDVALRRWQRPVRRKESVIRMTLSGLHYVVESLTGQRRRVRSLAKPESRSFPPNVIAYLSRLETAPSPGNRQEDEESFFEKPPPPPPPPPVPSSLALSSSSTPQHQLQSQADQNQTTLHKESEANATDAHETSTEKNTSDELLRLAQQKNSRQIMDGHVRRVRQITRDHYTSRLRYDSPLNETSRVKQDESVNLRRELAGGTRISPSTIDRIFDNSNRRQYGMGIVGRLFGSFQKKLPRKSEENSDLDDFDDHRPYFTYWITTVQVLILLISLACYGFGPVGVDLHHRSAKLLVTSLSEKRVDYQEPANFWFGLKAADLIHLGAKFAPCMRRDIKILKEIDVWRERERDTACCIRNDDSGCVQSSKADCSQIRGLRSTATNSISTWKKWGRGDSGPGGRISGSVCGLDPEFCDAPASIAPYEWPDDITKWPICRKTNPFNQRFSKNGGQRGNGNSPVDRYKDKMAEHMICEVIGHPCCIGIYGMCRITTKEYCDFVGGYFHEEASLCSQVECLHDVCGMIPFLHPEWPDQFYRLFTTTFLHAGILHLFVTLAIQYFLMRDLEKLTGSLRIALIYFVGALAGNLASSIFVPYRAEVGPAGAHFALLATLLVEVLHCWPMLKHPRRALSKLIFILLGLLILGILPWIDNYAHLFGFIFGFLAAYALMPFISFGHYDRRRKILLIWVCLILIVGLFTLLLAIFYNVPVYECEVCKLFNCVPFTRDFCVSQNINFMREESV